MTNITEQRHTLRLLIIAVGVLMASAVAATAAIASIPGWMA